LAELEEGPLRLVASFPAHASQTRDVQLERGTVYVVDFTLRALPVPTPYDRTLTFQGEIGCGLPTGIDCGAADAEPFHRFAVDSGLAGLVVELRWQPNFQGLAAELRAEVRAATPTACGLPYASGQGPSGFGFQVVEGHPLHGGHQCVRVSLGSGAAAASQGYQLLVTLFYHAPPEGFTAP
jgi:hypothetical protein